jgi:hypothetical protein
MELLSPERPLGDACPEGIDQADVTTIRSDPMVPTRISALFQ